MDSELGVVVGLGAAVLPLVLLLLSLEDGDRRPSVLDKTDLVAR